MQEAVTWIESIPQYNGVHPMTTGEFAFCEDDEIRVDLLLLFIRENRVVQLSIDHAGISALAWWLFLALQFIAKLSERWKLIFTRTLPKLPVTLLCR